MAMLSQGPLKSSLDAVSAQVVILDDTGSIVDANEAWQRFVRAHWRDHPVSVGSAYLSFYRAPDKQCSDLAKIADGLKSVLRGTRATFRLVYRLTLGQRARWFRLNAARVQSGRDVRVVVAHEDITEVREARRALGELSERLLVLQEEERQRIAEELHDSTAQHLAAIGLSGMSLRARMGPDAESHKLWDELERSLEEATKELRTFTYLLHPPRLEADGLDTTLQRYTEGFGKRTGLVTEVAVRGPLDDLSFPLKRSLLRIVQEALANVHRHASASRVAINLRRLARRLDLFVSDDGRGIDGRCYKGRCEPAHAGVGIAGMKARLREFDGTLEIETGPRGTTIHAMVPLSETQRKAAKSEDDRSNYHSGFNGVPTRVCSNGKRPRLL